MYVHTYIHIFWFLVYFSVYFFILNWGRVSAAGTGPNNQQQREDEVCIAPGARKFQVGWAGRWVDVLA